MKKLRISPAWRERAVIYMKFTEGDQRLDYSELMAEEMFRYESAGGDKPSPLNGFYRGKMAMDRTFGMWKEGLLEETLFPWELFEAYGELFIRAHIPDKFLQCTDRTKESLVYFTTYLRGRAK